MSFTIVRNDITKMEVDAIVNAANSRLLAGGGVCGAIFAAAGSEKLQAACDTIGYCGIGEAVLTNGFSLPARYIIHTVGPIYGENPREEATQLYKCYRNSLQLAQKQGLTSIAFPLISSGIYGYPKAEAMQIASRAIRDFLQVHEMEIYLVVYDRDAFIISSKLFSAVTSYIQECMVKADDRRRRQNEFVSNRSKERCFCAPGMSMPSVTEAQKAAPVETEKGDKAPKRSLKNLLFKEAETFSEMLLRLIDERGMTDVEVYKRANIDRKLFSKIRKKEYQPSKHTAIALAIAMRLSLDETVDLLKRAGYALSDCSKFDMIVEYCIKHEEYSIFEINEILFYYGQPLLGA